MNVKKIPLSKIILGENYRSEPQENDVAGLMASIKKEGLINPITVKKTGKGKFKLLAGYRRYFATKKLGLKEVDANILDGGGCNDLVINLVENIQREDTSSWEIGKAISKLVNSENMSKSEVAIRLGIPKWSVDMYLKFFHFVPKEFRNLIRKGAKGGSRKEGFIPNASAYQIVKLLKTNNINKSQSKKLFELARGAEGVGKSEISQICKEISSGRPFSEALKVEAAKKHIICKFRVSNSAYKKITKHASVQTTVRRLVEKKFGIKTYNV